MLLEKNWPELLQPDLRVVFDKHSQKYADFIGEVANAETSTKYQEINLGMGELSTMDPWTGQVAYEDFQKGYKVTYTAQKYSKGISIERELLEDDMYNAIKQRVQKLSYSVYFTRQTQFASVFLGAFSGAGWRGSSMLGPDALPLCSAVHPAIPGSTTYINNTGVLSLTAQNLEATRTLMMQWTDDKGNLIMINPDTIVVPPSLRKIAKIIAETDEEPETTDHGVNVWHGALKVIELPFISAFSNTWFLIDSERAKLYFNWYDRRKPDFDDKVEFDSEVAKYKVVGRWSFGWDDPSWVYGQYGG
jgi:phage major head subunit gpT-like protein